MYNQDFDLLIPKNFDVNVIRLLPNGFPFLEISHNNIF